MGIRGAKCRKNPSWAGAKDEGQLKYYAVYDKEHTEVVGSKKPNGLDLYDMGGNVLEWLEDCWHENYEGAPEDGSAWLEAKRGDCGRRVVRDGYCYDRPEFLRPSHRCGADAGNRNSLTGFRLAQDIEP